MNKLGITLEDLFNLPTAVIHNPDSYKTANYVSIDSRSIKKDSIFVAIKGERFDGHKFVGEAVKNGAGAVIIKENKLKDYDKINTTIITVKDTLNAYGYLAKIRRNKIDAKIVSITGSNGKTTTKEFLATLLSEKFTVGKSVANNNNHIGVPLTILSAKKNCEALVIEHGTNHFGEIKFTAEIAEPDYALITNIGDSHLEFLKNREGIYKEKSALFDAAVKRNGLIFINTDDPILKEKTKSIKNKVQYGFKGKPEVKGKITGYTDEGKSILMVSYKNKNIEVELPVIGEANAKNFIAACAIALKLGVTKSQIQKGAKKLKPVQKRLEVSNTNSNMIIDDTYNSSPDSMKNAIDVLKKIKGKKRKIIIAGDMFELGKGGAKLHSSLGEIIAKNKNHEVYTIGKLMKNLSAKLTDKVKVNKHFQNRASLKSFLNKVELKDSVILIKGSRGMKMEKFVEIIKQKAA